MSSLGRQKLHPLYGSESCTLPFSPAAAQASCIPSLPPSRRVAGGGGGSQGACAERPLSIRVPVRAVPQVGRREMATG